MRLAHWIVTALLILCVRDARADPPVMPHRLWLPGFGGLCDGGPHVCTRIDEIAFNARIDALLAPGTDRRGFALVTPYGFSFAILERLEGGIYTQTSVWRQTVNGSDETLWNQGPLRFSVKGLIWPWVGNPHQQLAIIASFELETRLWRFDGANQLGLLTDLGALRVALNRPLGLVELGLQLGALFDWQGRFGSAELGPRVAMHLPFMADTKVFAEALLRGGPGLSRVRSDASVPGTLDPADPIPRSAVLSLGLVTRPRRQVDFAVILSAGFGDTAPFMLTLRAADIAWGKGYPYPQSMVADAIHDLSVWIQEQVASVDPIFSDGCLMLDDDNSSMSLLGRVTPDRKHCLWNGLWLDKDAHYWRNKRGTLLCRDKARNDCFAERAGAGQPWTPLTSPAHTAVLRGNCSFDDAQSRRRLSHFGQLTTDGHHCSDGVNTFEIGQQAAYNPDAQEIDLGPQSGHRRGMIQYREPTTAERLATAAGRGVEAGQRENAQADDHLKALAEKADEMTLAKLETAIEAAGSEAAEDLKRAGRDPKGTFVRAFERLSQGVKAAARSAKEWTGKPALEEVEDAAEYLGRKATTAPRETTKTVAAGMAGELLGGMALGALKEGQAGEQLVHAAEHHRPKTGGHGPVLQGQAGVAQARRELLSEGKTIAAEEVTVVTSKGRRRIDLVVRDENGTMEAVEVKTGHSRYTRSQREKDHALRQEGGRTVGENAKKAGLDEHTKLPTTVHRY